MLPIPCIPIHLFVTTRGHKRNKANHNRSISLHSAQGVKCPSPLLRMQRRDWWDHSPEPTQVTELAPSGTKPGSQLYISSVPRGKEPRLASVWLTRSPCSMPGGCGQPAHTEVQTGPPVSGPSSDRQGRGEHLLYVWIKLFNRISLTN